MKRIVITGPESTGKTQLVEALAAHYRGTFIPEYARGYVESLDRKYTVEDVLHIARVQARQAGIKEVPGGDLDLIRRPFTDNSGSQQENLIFLDTWLVVTKVWLEVVFDRREQWIDDILRMRPVDLFLLCDADIPWEPDPVRENGGDMRQVLLNRYRQIINDHHYPVEIIRGTGSDRFRNAIFAIDQFLKNRSN